MMISNIFKNIIYELNWFKIKNSAETFGPDTKDPATVASITFNLLRVEENETVNIEQFIIG